MRWNFTRYGIFAIQQPESDFASESQDQTGSRSEVRTRRSGDLHSDIGIYRAEIRDADNRQKSTFRN